MPIKSAKEIPALRLGDWEPYKPVMGLARVTFSDSEVKGRAWAFLKSLGKSLKTQKSLDGSNDTVLNLEQITQGRHGNYYWIEIEGKANAKTLVKWADNHDEELLKKFAKSRMPGAREAIQRRKGNQEPDHSVRNALHGGGLYGPDVTAMADRPSPAGMTVEQQPRTSVVEHLVNSADTSAGATKAQEVTLPAAGQAGEAFWTKRHRRVHETPGLFNETHLPLDPRTIEPDVRGSSRGRRR